MNLLMKEYTKDEAAKYLGVSTKTIERWGLQYSTRRRKNFYKQEELDRAVKHYLGIKLGMFETEESEKDIVEKSIDEAFQSHKNILKDDLLRKVKTCSPYFFEHLVVELLVAMGYGGTLQDAGKVVGKSGDGGIDGIIKEDRLGLDVIYIQAKRWKGVVGRPDVQGFAGALEPKKLKRGIFITTSSFTKEAKEYVEDIAKTIILINGEELAELMVDYNVGVSVATNYEIKRIDSNYFYED